MEKSGYNICAVSLDFVYTIGEICYNVYNFGKKGGNPMKIKRILCALLTLVLLMSMMPMTFTASAAGVNLVPTEAPEFTANYTCTWNIQDWVSYHEQVGNGKGNNNDTKRDIVDPDHIFGNASKGITGWTDLLYPEARSDMLFLLDDGWDLPYGVRNKNAGEFGSMILQDDKFPKSEWGNTPREKLKTLNDRIRAKGWAGTGLWICAQESSANSQYYFGGNQELYWKERMEWCKYAGIAYWKVDWGNRMGDITWQHNLEKWADEVYPELIIEHAKGGTGGKSTTGNKRLKEDYLENAVEYAAFSDAYRTYDVLDQLMTTITLDRVGEQLIAGYTEKGTALGLMNCEDEMYIAASLGLTMGVMRFDPDLAKDTLKSGDRYFGRGTENVGGKYSYYGGGKKFTETRATRTALDEVTRALMWQRIAPAYAMGDYDTQVSNTFMDDSWQFASDDRSWEGDTGSITQRAPAAIARGIDLPTVKTSDGSAIPYLTASRNPNGAISIATHARTTPNGYQVNKKADVKLNAGDLTGLIGVFGYYGSLELTFNQNLTGKTILAQDLLAKESQNITSKVTIKDNTITIPGSVLEQVGLSAATKGDTSLPGLVIQIGNQSDFADPAPTNERLDSWDVNNGSFERFLYDTAKNESMKSVTGADWRRSGTTSGSYITTDAHSGKYAGTHAGTGDSVKTYQPNKEIQNGTYKVTAWIKSSGFDTTARMYAGSKSVDIKALGARNNWTQITIDNVQVTNNQLEVGFETDGSNSQWLIFDDVEVIQLEGVDESTISSDIILEFDFSDYNTNNKTVNGVVYDGGKAQVITANYKGDITFTTDADGNDIANFPQGADNTSVGITWQPGDKDPMEELASGSGATINIWLKPASTNFNSPLFMYGQGLDGTNLSHCVQTIIRGGSNKDMVLYRGDNGSSGGQKINGVTLPVNTSDWQMYTLVENGDKSISLYYNGKLMGTNTTRARGLLDLATDAYEDYFYIGCSPLAETNDTNFTGSMDTVTVYNGALGAAQVQALYDFRFAKQSEIVLEADGNGVPGGQAQQNDGYFSWMGYGADAKGDEGTASFRFHVPEAGEWTMDVYYLSNGERNFEIAVNGGAETTVTCPAGTSWNDVSSAKMVTAGVYNLKKGTNTIVVGNSANNAPSLVKVVLTKGNQYDVRAAEAVEEMIRQDLSIVDNYEQLPEVQACRAAYDALTPAQKALVDPEVYAKLTDAELLMAQWGKGADEVAAENVTNLINAIGKVTSLDQEDEIKAARAAYDALTDEQKNYVDAETVQTLEAAEAALYQLKKDSVIPGDLNADGKTNVSDIMVLKSLVMKGNPTEAQLLAGDMDGNNVLDTVDMAMIKQLILDAG